ncbi:Lrp/AsnC family transcriptional regulator [Sphingobium subterraneum]|uniref:Lrp/AsnC family transcriptional regulator n=1 Tax=Sphingobium subterraneum TaxID=627688 RepID=A0A841J539_9SPHN|nr:Lrp/AsnC family transcriptional regulator [Sphingobium subterraneum]MBB6124646.1 Lrp/AsnC family transcriptional regulator [Sphingobium subterraneum]
MDETDLRILRSYQARPDLSLADLAKEVGLSQTPCWRRLRRMEDEGVIVGRANLLDPTRLGFTVNVMAHIKLKQHDEESLEIFENAVRDHPQIIECFAMGGDSDYFLRVIARSIEDYEGMLRKVLLHLPGVAAVNSTFALKLVKATTAVPI